jgi:hypothetical protein
LLQWLGPARNEAPGHKKPVKGATAFRISEKDLAQVPGLLKGDLAIAKMNDAATGETPENDRSTRLRWPFSRIASGPAAFQCRSRCQAGSIRLLDWYVYHPTKDHRGFSGKAVELHG